MAAANESGVTRHARSIGRYANAFQVGFNAFELVIEFGEQFSDSEATQVHTRIITNPIYAQALLQTLSESLQQYRASFSAAQPNATDEHGDVS